MSEKKKIRGDLLRELIFFVYLRNKYDVKREVEVSTFKKTLGYSSGGIDYALKYSGFFEIEKGMVKLSEKGKEYVRRELLPQYRIYNPIGYFFMLLGVLIILQWYTFTYLNVVITFDLWAGLLLIITGFILRFFLLPVIYWALKIQKKL
ncbi:MAG: hypothetical protein OEZ35_04680 [Candidatus Bathyarchaeota archaeon]|nr:hypothetical protein [Candidatus Bathyarchaeota archaeon]